MSKIKVFVVLVLVACFSIFGAVSCDDDSSSTAANKSEKPEGALSVSELLENPVYDTGVEIYGEVSLLGQLDCPCFELASGGERVRVWYDLMAEDDGTERASVSVERIANGDSVVVIGELKTEGKYRLLNDFWASSIEKTHTTEGLILEKTYGDGKLYKAGEINVVILSGNYYEMGQQYGNLLKAELNNFYEATWESFTEEEQNEVVMFVKEISTGYTERQLEILRGMANASGLTITELMLLDQNIAVSFIQSACSFIAAWGTYTSDGTLIIGRNFDWYRPYNDLFSPYLTVVVYNPTSGGHSCATVGYAGMVNGLTGINDQSLFIEMNNGTDSMGRQIFLKNRTSYLNDMLNFLWDAGSIETLGKLIETTRPMSPVIINIANGKEAISYENAPLETKKRDPNEPGLLVATNHYMLPSWGILNRPVRTQSLERYDNLLKLGDKYKGKIDVDVMRTILDTPLGDGGATEIVAEDTSTNPDLTLYQVIAIPSEKTMWVKTPNYPDDTGSSWTLIDLNSLFTKNSPDV
jgi:hypothetical protein